MRCLAASPGSAAIPGTRCGGDCRDRLGAGLCASEEIDVELDAVVTVDDVRDIECDTFAILYDAATFGGRGAERNLQQTRGVRIRGADDECLMRVSDFDSLEACQDRQRGMRAECDRVAVVDSAVQMKIHDRIGRVVLELHTPEKYVLLRELAVVLRERR